MNKIIITILAFTLPAFTWANCQNKNSDQKCQNNTDAQKQDQPEQKQPIVENILEKLYKKTSSLKTLQADLEYVFTQEPDLLDAKTIRKAALFYDNTDKGSKMRINFESIQYDNEEPKKHIEQFIFKNYLLIKIDYQLKTVEYHHLPKPEKDTPFDAFKFLSQNFPMVGFTNPENLKKQFRISLIEQNKKNAQNQKNCRKQTSQSQEQNEKIQLFLDVKPESVYKNDYKNINLWINKNLFLPVHFHANSVNNDIYDIKLTEIVLNKKFKNAVFELETPLGFSQNTFPVKNN